MFNRAATNLNEKGVINLKKYKKYLYKLHPLKMDPAFQLGHLDPANNFADGRSKHGLHKRTTIRRKTPA